MKLMYCVTAMALLGVLHEGRADAVLDWNRTAIEAVVASKQPPPMTTRSMAMVHAAMFDAVNAFDSRYVPYRATPKPPARAVPQAAAAGAAHAVLVRLFPEQKEPLDAALAASLAASEANGDAAASAAFGSSIGAAMVAARMDDGTAPTGAYRPLTRPGRYVPTVVPLFVGWAHATPFVMERGSQFRPAAPPALTSEQWAADYNEIKALGAKAGSARTTLEPFATQSPTLPGVTRRWTRIGDYVSEISDARVWSGVHYRTSARVGEAMGRAIGEMAVHKVLLPVK